MEIETCENVFKFPHVFSCESGCCGLKPEQYCCDGDARFNFTVLMLCSLVILVLVFAWCWKKCTSFCSSNKRIILPDSDFDENECSGNDYTVQHNSLSSSFTNKKDSFKKHRSSYVPVKYQLRSMSNRESPPSYEEATMSTLQ